LKRGEIDTFIRERLPQLVDEAFAEYAAADKKELQRELGAKRKEIEETASKLGQQAFDATGQLVLAFRETPLGHQFIELETKAKAGQVADELKASVYNDLSSFFSRYYDDGDIFSKPRRGRVEIPFTGQEDVVLYWANNDQYYIKTSEQFKSYRFKADDFSVELALRTVTIEQNNNRGEKRYYILATKSPLVWDEAKKMMSIFFEYRSLSDKEQRTYGKTETQKPQDKLNETAEQRVLKSNGAKLPVKLKARLAQSLGEGKPSLLRHHLTRFTRKNTTDFFIHKNLRGFLAGELDDFIKAEVLRVRELLVHHHGAAERQLARARVVRGIAEKLITFLAQIEDFQKKLFEKRKFVVRTGYCATLDRVPDELWDEVLRNKEQIAEWRERYALDDTLKAAKKKKPDRDFLRGHDKLVIDTRYFDEEFKWRLLDKIDNLDAVLDGLLIKSENFQALALLLARFGARVQCIYIDPPFNTGTNEFLYKNNYLDSSWLCMLIDRLTCGRAILDESGNIFVRIDHHGDFYVRQLLSDVFGEGQFQNQIVLSRGRETAGTRGKLEIASEALFWYSQTETPEFNQISIPRSVANVQWTAFLMGGERKPRERVFLGKTLTPPDGQHWTLSQPKVDKLLDEHFLRLRCRHCGAIYFKAESDYRLQKIMKERGNRYKYYDILADDVVHGVEALTKCIECGKDMWNVDYLGAPTENVSNIWLDIESYSRSTGFFTENSEQLLKRVIELGSNKGDWVLDFFLGSGTTAAVAEKLGRKWIGVEAEEYFDEYPFPRMKDVIAGARGGVSSETGWAGGGMFKYQSLEQYEDALNNLELHRAPEGELALKEFGHQYLLRYMLEFETVGSASLLSLEQMRHPFAYKLKIQEGDEIVERVVDLVETFNYLLGFQVKKLRQFRDGERLYRATFGEQRNQKSAVVVWRDSEGLEDDPKALRHDAEFIRKQILPALLGDDSRPDRLLVNGPCVIADAEAIEPEFHRLMFMPIA
jgi:adenine-specific DNA-methyltransferase